jgi:hypothetical protein
MCEVITENLFSGQFANLGARHQLHTSHYILIDLDNEYEGDLLSDTPAAEARVSPFHLNYHCDQFWARPLRAWREEQAIFPIH